MTSSFSEVLDVVEDMKAINKTAQKIFAQLVEGLEPGTMLEPGTVKRIDKAPGAYMALSVERLGKDRFSMAHYYEQNGDLVADPDMEFWLGPDGRFYPVAMQNAMGTYVRAIEFGSDGKPSGFRPRVQAELASFAAMWLRNIKEQQL